MAINLQAHFDQEMVEKECCICYEIIGATNNCTTPCGHEFCFKCIVKCLGNSNACPYCRTALSEEPEVSDEEEDDLDDSDDDSDDETSSYIIQNTEATSNKICEQLVKLGYTMTDIISIYLGTRDEDVSKNTNEFVKKLADDIDTVVDTADNETANEFREREMFMEEDTRRHTIRVVKTALDTIGPNEPAILDTLFV